MVTEAMNKTKLRDMRGTGLRASPLGGDIWAEAYVMGQMSHAKTY